MTAFMGSRRPLIRRRVTVASTESSEFQQFLDRSGTFDTTHKNAYRTLIDGLVSDSLWNSLDILYIFATDTSSNALINLKSSSFTAAVVGAVTFTADQGFTGGTTGKYLTTGYTPSTASGVMTQNSAHISYWTNNNIADEATAVIGANNGTNYIYLSHRYTGSVAYCLVNTATASVAGTPSAANGFLFGNRSDSFNTQEYFNGNTTAIASSAGDASTSLIDKEIYILLRNGNGTPAAATTNQVSAVTLGSTMTAANQNTLYSRIAAYRTAVGL
jgi:hypothetical protein